MSYRKVLLFLWLAFLFLGGGLYALDWFTDLYDVDLITHIINGAACLVFFLMWLMINRVVAMSWFVCPILTTIAFYYFAKVDHNGEDVTQHDLD